MMKQLLWGALVVAGVALSGLLVGCEDTGNKSAPDYRYLPQDSASADLRPRSDLPSSDRVAEPDERVTEVCSPACEGVQCGPDGCGGICGQCEGNQDICQDGLCLCVAACAGKECGDDGCGGTCGECEAPFACQANKCECTPDCQDKECGYDGCFGECGSCVAPYACNGGTCGCAYGSCGPGDDLDAVCQGTSLGNCGYWDCAETGCCVVAQTPPPECCQTSDDCRDCIDLATAEVVPCPDAIPAGFVTHKCTKDVCGNNQCKHFDKVVFGECNDDDPCTQDACDPDSGVCTHAPIPDCTT
jgi:hypothetical protein